VSGHSHSVRTALQLALKKIQDARGRTKLRTKVGKGRIVNLSLVQSRALVGLDAAPVTVEVHLANGLPSFVLVGLADVEVKEAGVS